MSTIFRLPVKGNNFVIDVVHVCITSPLPLKHQAMAIRRLYRRGMVSFVQKQYTNRGCWVCSSMEVQCEALKNIMLWLKVTNYSYAYL